MSNLNINIDDIENLLDDWIAFRDEELSILSNEDKIHPLDFDSFENLILKNISKKDYNYVSKKLDEFYNQIMEFTGYYNDKYYKAGFADCLNLVIRSFGKKYFYQENL